MLEVYPLHCKDLDVNYGFMYHIDNMFYHYTVCDFCFILANMNTNANVCYENFYDIYANYIRSYPFPEYEKPNLDDMMFKNLFNNHEENIEDYSDIFFENFFLKASFDIVVKKFPELHDIWFGIFHVPFPFNPDNLLKREYYEISHEYDKIIKETSMTMGILTNDVILFFRNLDDALKVHTYISESFKFFRSMMKKIMSRDLDEIAERIHEYLTKHYYGWMTKKHIIEHIEEMQMFAKPYTKLHSFAKVKKIYLPVHETYREDNYSLRFDASCDKEHFQIFFKDDEEYIYRTCFNEKDILSICVDEKKEIISIEKVKPFTEETKQYLLYKLCELEKSEFWKNICPDGKYKMVEIDMGERT